MIQRKGVCRGKNAIIESTSQDPMSWLVGVCECLRMCVYAHRWFFFFFLTSTDLTIKSKASQRLIKWRHRIDRGGTARTHTSVKLPRSFPFVAFANGENVAFGLSVNSMITWSYLRSLFYSWLRDRSCVKAPSAQTDVSAYFMKRLWLLVKLMITYRRKPIGVKECVGRPRQNTFDLSSHHRER